MPTCSRPTSSSAEPSPESLTQFDHDHDTRADPEHEPRESDPDPPPASPCIEGFDLDEGPVLPDLDEDQVWDRDALAQAVDAVAATDPAARQAQRQIASLYDQLHQRLPPIDFALVLRIEELTNARTADLLVTVAAWAFDHGVRCGREAP